jgi:hypothetical protein
MVQGKCSGSPPARRACGDEQLRHFHVVHVFLDRRVAGGAERRKDQEHLVAFNQLARLLHCFRRTIGIVIGNEIDLAAVDASGVVDHPEIGAHRLADDAIGRCRPAVRHDVADLDLRVGDPGIVFGLGDGGHGGRGDDQRGKSKRPDEILGAALHDFLLGCGQA